MTKWIGLAAAVALTLAAGAACAEKAASKALTPSQAVKAAAAEPEAGVEGVFDIAVKSVGGRASQRGGTMFLNSEADYHNPANLSVMIRPAAVKEMEAALGGSLRDALANKRVQVAGVARRVPIAIYGEDNKKTGDSWFQTRITVERADQIVVR